MACLTITMLPPNIKHMNKPTTQVDVTFSDDGDLVSYVSLSQNRFRPDLSNGTLRCGHATRVLSIYACMSVRIKDQT